MFTGDAGADNGSAQRAVELLAHANQIPLSILQRTSGHESHTLSSHTSIFTTK